MSKHNKANKNNYVQAGRLTPDDMARERMKQMKREPSPAPRERLTNREPRQRSPEADEQESSRPETEPEEEA